MQMKTSLLSNLAIRAFLLSLVLVMTFDASAAPLAEKSGAKLRKTVSSQEDAGEFANFAQWKEVNDFIDQMVASHGFNKTELQAILAKVHYVDKAIQLIKPPPPGRPKNWRAYLPVLSNRSASMPEPGSGTNMRRHWLARKPNTEYRRKLSLASSEWKPSMAAIPATSV
jgi:membrane-bound lytic murein transglycosylase B